MRNNWIKKVFPVIVIALITIFLSSGGLSLTVPPDYTERKIDVLVSFKDKPGSVAGELIENAGGDINLIYHVVPAVAASVPKSSLDSLRNNPEVAKVEEDTLVHILGNKLPLSIDRIRPGLSNLINKGTGVKVAILDTGIDLDHPDLVVAGSVTFVGGTTNGDDDNGHGTLVAGIIGALDNGIGVTGVAPEVSLYSVKVLDRNGTGLMSSILSGIQWARDNDMQVINLSFGGAMQMPSTIKDALDGAYNAGIVIVAGSGDGGNAGGTGNNVWYPAKYESVIAVGATDNTNARYATSSTGYKLEVVATGVGVSSTAMNGGYGSITGTSAASSYTAGVAALLIKANVTNNVDIRHRLRDSARDAGTAGWDSQFGKGIVNAGAAINFSEAPDKSAPTTSISLSGIQGNNAWYRSDVAVKLTAADNPGGSGVAVTRYSLDGGSSWIDYGSPLTISTAGANLLLARSWDNAGNDEGQPAFKDVKIDRTLPATTISLFGSKGSNGWYVSNVGVELEGVDNPGGSGMAGIEYSLNGGAGWLPYFSQISVTSEGANTVLARTQDNAGNLELAPVSRTFNIDKAAPVTAISLSGTMGRNNSYTSNVIVTLAAADTASGVATTEYSLNSGGNWLGYSTPFTISNEGTTTVLARAKDNAGKLESPPASLAVQIEKSVPVTTASINDNSATGDDAINKTAPLTAMFLNGATAANNIDTAPPAPTISLIGTAGNNDWYLSNVTVTLTAVGDAGGVQAIEYSLNNGNIWRIYRSPFTVNDEGTTTILVRTRNDTGNLKSQPVSRTINIDKTPPVLNEKITPSRITRQKPGAMTNVSYEGKATDRVSGLYQVQTELIDEYGLRSRNLGSSLSGTVPVEAWSDGNKQNRRTYTLKLTATDMAGNKATADDVTVVR